MRELMLDDLDLAEHVRAGDTVIWGQACAEPRSLTERLMAQRAGIGGFRCFLGIPASATVLPDHADHVAFLSYCGAGSNRALWRAGALEILPSPYSSFPGLFASRRLPIDVALLLLPPPDEDGRFSIGLCDEYLTAAIDAARVVIAEVSDQMPQTHGGRTLGPDEIDFVVRTSRPPAELVHPPAGAVEEAIGHHVAGLVEDGSTLQFGIGALPEAVLRGLSGHRDLGVHSGLVSDAVADLTEAGVVTNARKTGDPGITVAGAVMGSRRVFGFVDGNDSVRLRATGYTHDPQVLAAQHNLVAINAAVEVDLTGQVNAEVARGDYIGAVGGAVDFARGASRSVGGRPITVLPSTAGSLSRIVSRLSGPVSTPRSEVAFVVTEHGVADLRGLTLPQRRRAMIAIADPHHRDVLERSVAHTGGPT